MKWPRTLPSLVSLALLAGSLRAEIIERVIARVNGDIVTQTEFQARQLAAVQQAGIGPDRIETYLRANNARLLQEAIDDLLLVQRAQETGVRIRPEYISEIVEGIKKENNIASDQAFEEQLRREGMSLDMLKRNVERQILRRQVVARELEAKASLTEAEILADYEARKAQYTKPATVRLQEILVKDAGAHKRAQELVAQARGGEDFAELARSHSAAGSARSHGDLGQLAPGDMSSEVAKLAAALEVGAISEPFASQGGWRILRVAERSAAIVTPFESVKTELRARLVQERMAKDYAAYLEDLRKNAIIDVRVREVPLTLTPGAVRAPEPPAGAEAPKPSPEIALPEVSGIETTGSARPQRVTPAPLPGEPQPAPSPSPSPQA